MENSNIQLLPATRKELKIKRPSQAKDLIIPGIAILLVLGIYFGLYTYKNSLTDSIMLIDQELIALENTRDKELEKNILVLDQQLAIIGPLISEHVLWSKGIAKLQSLINPRVQIISLNVGTSSEKVTFQAVADSYSTVAKQIAAFFSEESFKDVRLGVVKLLQSDQVDFSVEIIFDRNKLLK